MDFQSRFSRNIIFILLARISQQGESVWCKYFASSFLSARAMKWTKSLELFLIFVN